ncbi:unnamed protein product [Oikopleura dioica]|uniref:MH2 domain-containing protein n=1 Tax=Oikopleura dioica TaxID=34765 RepID=E4Y922_OIKDI|nr:unnamed protein product [Oikopleura dioica]
MKRRKQRPENIIRHHVDWARVSFYQKKMKRGPDFIARSRSFTIDGMTGPRCTSTRMPLGIRTLGLRGCPDTDRLLETVGHGIVIENKENSVLLRNISPVSVYVKSCQIDSTPIRIPAAHEVDLFFYDVFSRSIAERNTLADLWQLREHCTLFISFGLCWGSSTVQVENVDGLPCWLKLDLQHCWRELNVAVEQAHSQAASLKNEDCDSGSLSDSTELKFF